MKKENKKTSAKFTNEVEIKRFVKRGAAMLPCIFCGSETGSGFAGLWVTFTAAPVDGLIGPERVYGYKVCEKCKETENDNEMGDKAEKKIIKGEGKYIYLGRMLTEIEEVAPSFDEIETIERLKLYDKINIKKSEEGYYTRPVHQLEKDEIALLGRESEYPIFDLDYVLVTHVIPGCRFKWSVPSEEITPNDLFFYIDDEWLSLIEIFKRVSLLQAHDSEIETFAELKCDLIPQLAWRLLISLAHSQHGKNVNLIVA